MTKESGFKGSPEAELEEKHVEALTAELDTLPMVGRDLAHMCRASTPRGAVHTHPATRASGEYLDTYHIASRKPVALPRVKFPKKTQRAQDTEDSTKCHTAGRPGGPDPTPLSGIYNNPRRNTQVSCGGERAAQWILLKLAKGRTWHRTPLALHIPAECLQIQSALAGD